MSRVPLDIPPGIVSDETATTVGGRAWADGDKVRFWRKRWQILGGWERFIDEAVNGVCRNALPWTDNIGALVVGFGSHSHLEVCRGGEKFDITPTLARAPAILEVDPLSTLNASPTVTVAWPGHGLSVADSVVVSGATAIGGITPNGTFAVTVVTDDTFEFTFGSNATSTVAGGGGAAVKIAPQAAFQAGAINGTGTSGYSTGAYSVGGYSEPSTQDYFARTWALDTYGESLMATPRGGTVYWWQNDTMAPAAPLLNAPRQVTFMLVTDQRQVMAFGCNEEGSGRFNPLCIRFSDLENPEEWTTRSDNNAGEVILKGGGRLVAARAIGQYLFVWTDNGLYLGTYVGDPSQTWRFDRIGGNCGLMGPNAVVVVGQTARWPSPAGQFYTCTLGGAPDIMPCDVRTDFIDHLTPSQADKVVASSCAQFAEIRFDYPDDRDGFENSRYIAVSLPDGAWTRGIMARSAYVDAGPSVSPIGVTPAGQVYWHERGKSADGEPLTGFIESADQTLNDDRAHMMIRDIEPDFEDQSTAVWLTLSTRDYAQAPAEVYGPYALAVGADFLDLRAEGRFVKVRFEWSSVTAFARSGRPSFDAVKTGQR